jgi:F-type H+-transporting ATPase subunit epsilon
MLKVSIATPQRRVVSGLSAKSVTLPTSKGEITILPDHISLISTIGIGVLVIDRADGKKEVASIANGFLQVFNNEVIIAADRLELAHEIDIERARRAQKKAEEAMLARTTFLENIDKWEKKYLRSQARIMAAQYLLPPH